MKRATMILGALLLFLGGGETVKAAFIWTLNDTTNKVSGTVEFVKVTGGFEIKVINTEVNTPDAGHAISQIQFTFGGNLGAPTAFTELKGTETDFSGSTANKDYTSPDKKEHWPFQVSGSTVSLLDVGGSYGGQPDHLIVAANSNPNSSLTNTHIPSFIGEVDFFFADAMVPSTFTTNDITGVKLGFGTKPEYPLESLTFTGNGVSAVPEPATYALLGMGFVGMVGYQWRRRKQAA